MTNEETASYFEEIIKGAELLDVSHAGFVKVDAIRTAFKALQERKTGKWIPVSERLPENLIPVNITWVNHNPAPYYAGIKDKPFTATGVYFNGQWYWWSTLCTDMLAEYCHNYDDIIDDDIEIIAWQPLPEPYKEVNE